MALPNETSAAMYNEGSAEKNTRVANWRADNVDLRTLQTAIITIPLGHVDLVAALVKAAEVYESRYENTQNLSDLQIEILYREAAISGTSANGANLAFAQYALAWSLSLRYKRLDGIDDLHALIVYMRAALATISTSSQWLPNWQITLANSYTDRYNRLHTLPDLRSALELEANVVSATPLGHPYIGSRLSNLGISYKCYFEETGSLHDLNASIIYKEAAIDSSHIDDEERIARQVALSASYTARYTRLGNDADLLAALMIDKDILENTPPDHPHLANRQLFLGISYRDYFSRYGTETALEASIKYKKAALENTLEDDPEYTSRQIALATSYTDRYSRYGDLADLEATIHLETIALQNTFPGTLYHASRQSNLGMSYQERFLKLGDLDDLDTALKHKKAALENTPLDGPSLPDRQAALSTSYTYRYHRLGALDDLATALRLDLAALENMPQDHPDRSARQNAVGMSYRDRYTRLSDPADLEASIGYKKAALLGTPPDHRKFRERQISLAVSFTDRYTLYGDLKDLEVVLGLEKAALETTPEDDPHYPLNSLNLATSHNMRYERLGEQEDLSAAIKFATVAVEKAPPGHDSRGAYIAYLAGVHASCYESSGDISEKGKGLALAQLALDTPSTKPNSIWETAIKVANHTSKFKHPISIRAYKRAFTALSDLLWIGTSLTTRHHVLIEHRIQARLAEAIGWSIYFGEYHSAVEFMEQGLSITHQQSLGLKSNDLNLQQTLPSAAAELQKLSAKILELTDDTANSDSSDYPPDYLSLTVKRNRLIETIRKYPEHRDFLKPSTYEKLSYAAANGPVILLNCVHFRTDAIIILRPATPPIPVQLDGVDPETAERCLDVLKSVLAGFRIDTSRNNTRYGRPVRDRRPSLAEFQQITSWLWASVVEPVFKVLCDNGVLGGRIWWCMSGPFTYLPVHSAAPVDSPYIQSYTTSLGALLRAGAGPSIHVSNEDLCTAIGVARLPGLPEMALPLVPDELDRVVLTLKNQCTVERLDADITVTKVLKAMETSSWLHLACHGKQDPEDPLKSHLILPDGNLELRTILRANLPSARFVFLSACETAMGDSKLANEAMHFTGGFIAAGFRGAIGTLWSMADSDGPRVAETVYKNVCKEGRGLDVASAAEGLHLAIQGLRKAGVPPHRWIPFVHFGI